MRVCTNFAAIALALVARTSDAFVAPQPAINDPVSVISSVSAAKPAAVFASPAGALPAQKELLSAVPRSPSVVTAAATSNAASGAGITISDIYYDGVVPKTEADEYIVVTNTSKNPIDVSKYFVYVATTGTQGPTFYFPSGTMLKGGQAVRVYTNEVHKETGGYSFGSGKAIWNNGGGLAVLKDAGGKKVVEYKYKPTPKAS